MSDEYISEIMPPDTSEIRHLHKSAEQFFYVLEGALAIELEGHNHQLKQHEGLIVLPVLLIEFLTILTNPLVFLWYHVLMPMRIGSYSELS